MRPRGVSSCFFAESMTLYYRFTIIELIRSNWRFFNEPSCSSQKRVSQRLSSLWLSEFPLILFLFSWTFAECRAEINQTVLASTSVSIDLHRKFAELCRMLNFVSPLVLWPFWSQREGWSLAPLDPSYFTLKVFTENHPKITWTIRPKSLPQRR